MSLLSLFLSRTIWDSLMEFQWVGPNLLNSAISELLTMCLTCVYDTISKQTSR